MTTRRSFWRQLACGFAGVGAMTATRTDPMRAFHAELIAYHDAQAIENHRAAKCLLDEAARYGSIMSRDAYFARVDVCAPWHRGRAMEHEDAAALLRRAIK